MRKTVIKIRCLFCDNEFVTTDIRKKFCNSSCSASYNNKNRVLEESTKEKISKGLKIYFDENPKKIYDAFFWNGVKTSKGKFLKNPQSIFTLSSRTRIKVLERLNLSCFRCGWNDDICDLHHIYGRKIENPHNHKNLTYVCPNCHRLAQNKKILPEDLITLEEKIGDEWKKYYYG